MLLISRFGRLYTRFFIRNSFISKLVLDSLTFKNLVELHEKS